MLLLLSRSSIENTPISSTSLVSASVVRQVHVLEEESSILGMDFLFLIEGKVCSKFKSWKMQSLAWIFGDFHQLLGKFHQLFGKSYFSTTPRTSPGRDKALGT